MILSQLLLVARREKKEHERLQGLAISGASDPCRGIVELLVGHMIQLGSHAEHTIETLRSLFTPSLVHESLNSITGAIDLVMLGATEAAPKDSKHAKSLWLRAS